MFRFFNNIEIGSPRLLLVKRKISKLCLINLVVFSSLFYAGCTIVDQTIYVQDIKVKGPINQPPLHITGNDKTPPITISPKIYFNTTQQSNRLVDHTNVNENGTYQVDTIFNNDQTWRYKQSPANTYQYKGQNLKWDLPNLYTGIDVDLPLSNKVSISGSFNYANQEEANLLGGSVGLGFSSISVNNAMRIDIGLTFQEYWYDAATIVVTTSRPAFGNGETTVDFFHDINKNTSTNPYISITYNSISKDMPFNFYGSLSLFGQTLFDVEPANPNPVYYPFGITTITNDTRRKYTTSYISFAPGIYKEITEDSKIILGVNLLKDLSEGPKSNSFYVIPMIKFQMSL
jgi:hypothetical protein